MAISPYEFDYLSIMDLRKYQINDLKGNYWLEKFVK